MYVKGQKFKFRPSTVKRILASDWAKPDPGTEVEVVGILVDTFTEDDDRSEEERTYVKITWADLNDEKYSPELRRDHYFTKETGSLNWSYVRPWELTKNIKRNLPEWF